MFIGISFQSLITLVSIISHLSFRLHSVDIGKIFIFFFLKKKRTKFSVGHAHAHAHAVAKVRWEIHKWICLRHEKQQKAASTNLGTQQQCNKQQLRQQDNNDKRTQCKASTESLSSRQPRGQWHWRALRQHEPATPKIYSHNIFVLNFFCLALVFLFLGVFSYFLFACHLNFRYLFFVYFFLHFCAECSRCLLMLLRICVLFFFGLLLCCIIAAFLMRVCFCSCDFLRCALTVQQQLTV